MTALIPPCTAPEMARHLARFHHHDRNQIEACAQISPRVAQLAISFPLLFSVLASSYGPPAARASAITATNDSAILRTISRLMGLPYCLRHVAPEACPSDLVHYRWSSNAHRQLHPLIPADDATAHTWLSTIFFVARRSDETVAIWVARLKRLHTSASIQPELLQPLIMFAWYSLHYPAIVSQNAKWSPDINMRNAVQRCVGWLKSVALFTALDVKGVVDPWLPESHEGGLSIVPLTTPVDILLEASAMRNCLVDYAEAVAIGNCRLFSVRFEGKRIASLMLTLAADRQTLVIAQIKAAANEACPMSVRAKVDKIVSGYQPRTFSKALCRSGHERVHLSRVLLPYRQALSDSEHSWLDMLTLERLYEDLHRLAGMMDRTP